ncbi:hypothetical protein [Streptomyces montanisoli]|uniref:DUF624 domain-containing protein n=1 Tax=Streptomyces montanisoli TaxID=2798581 RepID=A0A940MIX0_9ACTN|nr:hypothetical protein [Streptomyces montanisoli]MBP0461653.1 hypothetical protein [Streptomyces montanisoli]
MTQIHTQRTRPARTRTAPTARPARLALSAERGEQVRTAAETMAVGVLFAVFSLPLVTAGAAWCAGAEIVASWHAKREPALLRTFTRAVGRNLAAGFVVEGAVLVPLAAAWFEVHVVVRSRMPGYPVEAVALALLGAAAAGFVLLTAAFRAADAVTVAGRRTSHGGTPGGPSSGPSGRAPASWGAAVRRAADLTRATPSALVLVVTGCAFCVVLVALIPAFAAFMAGPLAFAVSTVVARGTRGRTGLHDRRLARVDAGDL